jgi:hypothetical protein
MPHGLIAALRLRGSDAVEAAKLAQLLIYREMQRQAAMLAFIDVFWILGVLCLAMIPLMFTLKNSQRRSGTLGIQRRIIERWDLIRNL